MSTLSVFRPILLLILFYTLNSCGAQETVVLQIPEGSQWELIAIYGDSTSLDQLYPENRPTLNFDTSEPRIYGFTGCNQYSYPYVLKKDSITLSPAGIMTQRACLGEGEDRFMTALTPVTFIKVVQEKLVLYNLNRKELLSFKKITL